MPDLKPGGAHLDAQRFGLVAAGNGAAIVVGQHHHRKAAQAGAEDPLTRHVEVVAINQGVLRISHNVNLTSSLSYALKLKRSSG